MPASLGVGATLLRSWTLLCRNWSIVLPSIVLGVAGAELSALLERSGWLSWGFFGNMNAQGPGAFWAFVAAIVAMALRILAAIMAIAYTTGMAAAAWTSGTARIADGAAAFFRSGLQAFLAFLLMALLGLVAAALLEPTFGISVFVYMIFMLYAMPGVLVGNRPAVDAIVESFALAWRSFGVTFVLVLLIVGLAILGGFFGDALARIPYAGNVLGWVVMEVVVAYATLVVVGEYLQLRRPPDQAT